MMNRLARPTREKGPYPFFSAAAILLAILTAFEGASVQAAGLGSGLTASEPLAKAYALILGARFEEAERQLKQACGAAPPTACDVIRAVSDYWRLLLDAENTTGDGTLLAKINASIASGEAWVAREPKRGEAWFYLGGAYGTRVMLRGLRAQYLAAARDGKRIHDSLQMAVKLDPTLQDAFFGLGIYHYYAAIAPRAVRVLRALLLLPGGNRAGGLREMEQTQSRGMLLRGEADYQLHLIYLWYENQPATSLRLIEGLRARYPHNPVFSLRTAVVQSEYLNNHRAALETYRTLFEAARAGRVAAPAISEVNARLGMAQQMEDLCDFDRAIEQLRAVIAQRPSAPYGAVARAHYQLGVVNDRIGRRSEAVHAYQSALAALPSDDRLRLGEKVRAASRRTPTRRSCG
jgi:tetratricopeptide (TPR) repeat protein